MGASILSARKKTDHRKKYLPVLLILLITASSISLLAITSALASPADELEQTSRQIGDLENQSAALDDSYNQALKELVAVDTEVQRYGSEIEAVKQQSEEIQNAIETGEQRLVELEQQLQERQSTLEKRITSSYKSDDMGYIEVVMGAGDFSDFLNRVDMVNKIAEEDHKLIASYEETKRAIEEELSSLAAKREELAALHESLNVAEQSLLAAQAEQQAYVNSLESQMAANSSQLASLQAEAADIEARMSQIQAQSAPQGGGGGGYTPPPASGTSFTATATAYCLQGRTATGMPAGPGIIAVDPGMIPLGSQVYVSGYGNAIAADTGGAIHGNRIDVWLPCGDAYAWGVRTVTVTVY